MRILMISYELLGAHLCYLMKNDGHDVKLFLDTKDQQRCFDNLVPKVHTWKRYLNWVGKDGLIVFDHNGYGGIQDKLRAQGYSVFGGSELSDKLENDRQWAQDIFQKFGLRTLPTYNFQKIGSAIAFLKKNLGPWVIKQNGHASKGLSYVSNYANNQDTLSVLQNYQQVHKRSLGHITLQKRVYGVEIGVGRYFNGEDWIGPIEINQEYKKMFPGDIGPTTSEMGTIAWYDDDENNILFQKTIARMKPFLREIDFRGDFEIGCIANEQGIFVLEATPRMGSPIIHLHSEIHSSPWNELLKAVADKKTYDLKWKKGMGIVLLVALPPFPYSFKIEGNSPNGIEIFFDPSISNDSKHIHFEEVAAKKHKDGSTHYYIPDDRGSVLYVTAMGSTIKQARDKAQTIINKIHIPNMFYRNDIGVSFETFGKHKLIEWGYLQR